MLTVSDWRDDSAWALHLRARLANLTKEFNTYDRVHIKWTYVPDGTFVTESVLSVDIVRRITNMAIQQIAPPGTCSIIQRVLDAQTLGNVM